MCLRVCMCVKTTLIFMYMYQWSACACSSFLPLCVFSKWKKRAMSIDAIEDSKWLAPFRRLWTNTTCTVHSPHTQDGRHLARPLRPFHSHTSKSVVPVQSKSLSTLTLSIGARLLNDQLTTLTLAIATHLTHCSSSSSFFFLLFSTSLLTLPLQSWTSKQKGRVVCLIRTFIRRKSFPSDEDKEEKRLGYTRSHWPCEEKKKETKKKTEMRRRVTPEEVNQ